MKKLILIASLWSSAQAQLNGVWVRPCANGNIQVQNFEGPKNYTDDILFQDIKCSKPLLSFGYDGTSIFRSNEMDYTFSKVSLTLYEKSLVEDYNQRSVCGFSNWSTNSPKVITGLQCALFQQGRQTQVPKLGDRRYGIWKLESGKLYFGKLTPTHPANTPETRPIEWDSRAYFKQL